MHHSALPALVGALCLLLAGGTGAVSSVSTDTMATWLSNGGVDLAEAAAPMWFFGQAMDEPPCYPTAALDSSNGQVASVALCDWPDTGCNCRKPGVAISNPGPSFPVYFSFLKCSSSEIRVVYNLFYQKDGFNPSGVFGHAYDWERVVVKWTLSGSWTPSHIMLSQHSGYQTLAWAKIQNTFNTADVSLSRAGSNGRTNLDHAKVYVAWSKHAHYNTRNTGYNDALSQLTDNAFRSQDWWYFPTSSDYILADNSTSAGKILGSFDWGDATSDPLSVYEGLCSAS
ncbi:hypothetical protein CMQ_849 [Grosmannia clavigera kw1407]|uniref:Uncharacterized protein n=1 Tax=Grosmannia clavigera (strain kw1407 / UAMH 11150) TaxID=655863 RepID=F0XCJ2_GROCL|nr:uncharacterized protein CMQ_849 [Grosmannia clavigera kw1407]EFX03921.1 hypothetical protein CMQ_849 [Grosmannia clavigera kw1407]